MSFLNRGKALGGDESFLNQENTFLSTLCSHMCDYVKGVCGKEFFSLV